MRLATLFMAGAAVSATMHQWILAAIAGAGLLLVLVAAYVRRTPPNA
jgi:hypothetical protein